MKRYRLDAIKEMDKSQRGILNRALQCGILDEGRIFIYLPDDFGVDNGIKGMGDLVAIMAKPIARKIDLVLGTNLANCNGCAKRQEFLNEIVPFKN